MNEEVMIPKSYHDKVCEEIIRFKDKQFYDAVHLLDDGTLEITVGDYTKVKRVLVEDGNNFGNLFYEDADRPQGEWTHDNSSPIAYRCTVCNTLQHWSVIQNGRYRFCPNCGARMLAKDTNVPNKKGASDD